MFPHRHNISGGDDGLEQMLHFLSSTSSSPMPLPVNPMERSSDSRWKPHIEIAPNCPRCASTNTKFCYYNNYSLSQPRYFCKGCRRYWTKGGSLRNVPVGGGCRKTRRGKSARNPQSDPLSSNSSEDNGDGHQKNQSGSRDIDMALVFAKFLNQNPSSGEEFENEANNGSSSSNNNNNNLSTPESVEIETENDAVVIQPQQKRFDIADALLVGGGDSLEEMRVDHQVQNFGGEELSLSGMDEFEGFLGVDGDVVHDVLWYDDAIVPSSNTWQQPPPVMQMHELPGELEYYSMPLNEDGNELLPVCSSSTSTANLICESWSSWSSFDLSTMEVFSSSSTP